MTPTKLTIRITRSENGFTAVCLEFGVAGSADTQEEALNCLGLALRATLSASANSLRNDPSALTRLAEVELVAA